MLRCPFAVRASQKGSKLLYLFENCTLDTERREVRRGSALVPVEPQVFDLLEYLIRNRERVVSKDDLLASIWDGRVVSESALSTRINAARSAIGDSGDRQRLIKTAAHIVGDVHEEQKLESETAPRDRQEPPRGSPSIAAVATNMVTIRSKPTCRWHGRGGHHRASRCGVCHRRNYHSPTRTGPSTYVGRHDLGAVLEGGVRRGGSRRVHWTARRLCKRLAIASTAK